MPVTINLRVLEQEEELHLAGDLPVEEFGEDLRDELMRFDAPLHYELDAQQQPDSFVVTGTLETDLACECSRCLQPFRLPLRIDNFATLVQLQGEDALKRDGDFGDLTPLLREDIYLGLPTNPLCRPDCRGLPQSAVARDSRLEEPPSDGPSPWAALDQIKL
ncbi:MAG: hypothetical protein RIS76_617 [Verrucomicrobiota bacterium]|jgi:uncharacterized protein